MTILNPCAALGVRCRLVSLAVAVQAGLFVAVGPDAVVRARYPDATHINVMGQAVLPGLIDSHAHLLGLGLVRQTADLVGATSLDDIRARLEYATSCDTPPAACLAGQPE